MDVGLKFKKSDKVDRFSFEYANSDYVGDLDKRRSTTCFIFTIAGVSVSWQCTLQSKIALSTTETEYMALIEAIKEAIWLLGLVADLGIEQEHVVVFCDSQSVIH
ncbi:secreted RxLR effector protein 161-like [Actinidia eriantha]|uniref:secreted RxLR effector protein 161-like n=1 Tax=Actinidia eriantha TaxID=165200 RepID=UPI00258EC51B|nr:secreted RxLR effector protein 161-like [Actinidia eriantha]